MRERDRIAVFTKSRRCSGSQSSSVPDVEREETSWSSHIHVFKSKLRKKNCSKLKQVYCLLLA